MALDRTLMAVPVPVSKESIKLGTAEPLFRTSVISAAFSLYDVSADGKRFVLHTDHNTHDAAAGHDFISAAQAFHQLVVLLGLELLRPDEDDVKDDHHQ